MTQPTPTTLPEALAELSLVRSELERWRRFANQLIEEKKELEDALRVINPEHPLLRREP
jgi:hypothetical protein